MAISSINLSSAKTIVLTEIKTHATSVINNTNKLKMTYKLNTDNTISTVTNEISSVTAKTDEKGFVYFIFDSTGTFCLYVGKSNNLRKRLGEHLDKPSSTTRSKYNEVVKYVRNGGTTLLFDYLKVDPEELYGAAEGQFISFFEEIHIANGTEKRFWNIRHD